MGGYSWLKPHGSLCYLAALLASGFSSWEPAKLQGAVPETESGIEVSDLR